MGQQVHWSEQDNGDTPANEVMDNEMRKRGWPVTDANRVKLVHEALEHLKAKGLVTEHNGGWYAFPDEKQ